MDFKKITIPYEGREAYPAKGTGESVRTIISNYLGGASSQGGTNNNNTVDSGGYSGSENRGGMATSFFCFLSKTSGTYSSIDLAQGSIQDTLYITGFRNSEQAQTLVGDISESSTTTNYSISGLPASGISVSVSGNGTTGTSIVLTIDSTISEDSGTLTIPVAVNISQNQIDPYHTTWYNESNKCVEMTLKYSWAINRDAEGNYILDLSNQGALVNCDSAGTLYPNSIATLQCTATTYYGGGVAEGITYSAHTESAYAATGFSINQNTGELTFNSAGTRFYWNPNYPALPINIIAYKNGTAIATKTMTITRNYPGTDGTAAHTWYIVTDYDVVRYNPNTNTYSPSAVTGRVMLQIGDQEPEYDTAATLYQWYNDLETGKTTGTGSITVSTQYTDLESITFALMNSGGDYYEIEEVPVLSDGEKGEQGPSGATGSSGESSWNLTLTNSNASINCDSSGNILPGAIRPSCQAKLYHGNTMETGVTWAYDDGGASGITYIVSNGVLAIICGSDLNFTGTTLSIYISASTEDTLREVKVMNITKTYAGAKGDSGDTPYISGGTWWIGDTNTGVEAQGESGCTPEIINGYWYLCGESTGVKAEGDDAISYWLEPSFTEVQFNPNTSAVTPSAITCSAYKQVGQQAVVPASDVDIKVKWQSRSTGGWLIERPYDSTGITINAYQCQTYSRIRFVGTIDSGNTQVDYQDVNILTDGVNGTPGGQGRAGAAIRGPYDFYTYSASTRCWCSGEEDVDCDDCDKWIDVIVKDGTYYYCNTNYYGTLSPWALQSQYWTSGDTFDFVAAKLILASGASIDFLTNNEMYLRDNNNQITGGARGGSGVTFWAGSDSPGDAPWQVDTDGNFKSETGVIGGWAYDSSGLTWDYYDGVENYEDAHFGQGGLSFGFETAGDHTDFIAGTNGIKFTTERYGVTGLDLEGDNMNVILADGEGSIPTPLSAGIHTNMDVYGHNNVFGNMDMYGLKVKTPTYVEGDMVKVEYSAITSDGTTTNRLIHFEPAVTSPFAGLKIAVQTSTQIASDWFSTGYTSGGSIHWFFNNDLDTKINGSSFRYMKLITSAAVVNNWQGLGYPGVPSDWVGMWCASDSNTISSSAFYYPTGIYGPTFYNKRGDTLYFTV